MIEQSENINELMTALALAQSKMNNPHKNKTAQGVKYADLSAIIDAAKPSLVECGLSIIQFPYNAEDRIGVSTQLSHKSGQWVRSHIEVSTNNSNRRANDVQQAGTVITYLRRYALSALLFMFAEDDTDGNYQKNDSPQKSSLPPQKPAAAPQINLGMVKTLMLKAGTTQEDVTKWCEAKGVKSLEEFSQEQLASLYNYLQKQTTK